MRSNSSSVYPADDFQDSKNSQRSSLAIDVSKRIRLFTSSNDLNPTRTSRNRARRTTVACVPHSTSSMDSGSPWQQHRSVTELRDFQFYKESPYKKNNGKARTRSSEEIFLEDVQDEVCNLIFQNY